MEMAKLICEDTVSGETVIRSYTTAAGAAAAFAKIKPGVGKPFWCWPLVPAGTIIAADFTGAPVVSSNVVDNQAAIDAITALPSEVLVYAP